MLRFALGPDGSVVPDLRRKLPGRGVWTRLSFDTVSRAAAKQSVFARLSRQGGGARLAGRDGRRAPRARRVAVAVDRQQGRPRRGRRVQGRLGDRGRRRVGADSGERRGGGRSGKASPGPARETGPRGRRCRARRSLQVAAIGFGIGAGKCDTCCPQTWGGEFGLSRKGGSFASLSRGEADAASEDRARRRDGRRGRNVWQAHQIG